VPSMAFALESAGSAPPWSAHAGFSHDAAGSLHAADRPLARPLAGTLLLRFDGGLSPDAGSRATGDPGVSPGRTRTGWPP
jgi:hypothetical protein